MRQSTVFSETTGYGRAVDCSPVSCGSLYSTGATGLHGQSGPHRGSEQALPSSAPGLGLNGGGAAFGLWPTQ